MSYILADFALRFCKHEDEGTNKLILRSKWLKSLMEISSSFSSSLVSSS